MEERNYNLEIEQLQNLKINRGKIQKVFDDLTKKEKTVNIRIGDNDVHFKAEYFENFEVIYSTLRTLALADLNKQLAKIEQEIKNRLKQ